MRDPRVLDGPGEAERARRYPQVRWPNEDDRCDACGKRAVFPGLCERCQNESEETDRERTR